MLEHLTRFFTAVRNLRRSERALVRSGALMELEELYAEVYHPKLKARIGTVLAAEQARAS